MASLTRILLVEDEVRIAEVAQMYALFELIDTAQGCRSEGYERTIDAHVKNLHRKLDEDARAPRRVLTVYGRRYAFVEEQK
jgi:two-component system alkaline phosphatase synthesis response regulator PhoP